MKGFRSGRYYHGLILCIKKLNLGEMKGFPGTYRLLRAEGCVVVRPHSKDWEHNPSGNDRVKLFCSECILFKSGCFSEHSADFSTCLLSNWHGSKPSQQSLLALYSMRQQDRACEGHQHHGIALPVTSRPRPWLHQLTPEPRHFPSQIPVLLDQGVSKTTPKRKGLWSRKYSWRQQQLNTWLGCSSVEEVLSVRKALGSILDTTKKVLS